MPIALISLVAEDTVEFAGNAGLPGIRQVARPDSVCSVAVLHESTTVFEDLHASPCQLTNQDAARQLNLGFYAAHPLRTPEGYNIGALCIIDHQSRPVSAAERERLAALAAVVMQLLDVRVALLAQPDAAAAMWNVIHQRISTSLTRLDTLRALNGWEETATTAGALQYEQSIAEEAHLITQALRAELATVRQQLAGR